MIVYAIYYVITEDGRTILSQNFHSVEGISDGVLLGGVFTALQTVTKLMTGSDAEINSIEMEGLSYHIRSFGLIRIVLVTDIPKKPEEIIQILGFRFLNEYGDILMQTDFNLNIFDPFKDTIQEVIPQKAIIDESKLIKPSLKLGTGEIFNLPFHLQNTALALVSLGEGTMNDIAQESCEIFTDTKKHLLSLQKYGICGI